MTYTADPRHLKVKTPEGKFLFEFDASTRTITLAERGQVFSIPMWLIEEHLRTSQRDTLTIYGEPAEERLPCGHTEGTVLTSDLEKVCSVCGV